MIQFTLREFATKHFSNRKDQTMLSVSPRARSYRQEFAFILVALMALWTSAPATAAETERSVADSYTAVNEYITDEGFLLNDALLDTRIAEKTAIEFAVGYYIGGGHVVTSNSRSAITPSQELALDAYKDQLSRIPVERGSCVGRTGARAFWPTVYLNSCQASVLNNLLNAGAGVAGVAGLLTGWTGIGAVGASAIASALVITGGIYGLCNSWGRGIKVYVTPAAVPVCWAQ